jgi:hypothetical protein
MSFYLCNVHVFLSKYNTKIIFKKKYLILKIYYAHLSVNYLITENFFEIYEVLTGFV